jgi:PKD repeat protein
MKARGTLSVAVAVALSSSCARPLTPPLSSPPVANAGFDINATIGSDVVFDGSASTDDGEIVAYRWQFGDGSEGAEGQSVVYAYSSAGGYVATLEVEDDDGETATDTVIVTVAAAGPTAAASVSPLTATVGESVAFDGSASASVVPIASASWTFGDGARSSDLVTSHSYGAPGVYTARLSITDDDDATDSVSVDVTVSPPDIDGTWTVTSSTFSCANYPATFPDNTLVFVGDELGAINAGGADGRAYDGAFNDGGFNIGGDVIFNTGSCGNATVDVTINATLTSPTTFTARATGFFALGAGGCQCSAVWDLSGAKQ